jgi:uncharacterized protein
MPQEIIIHGTRIGLGEQVLTRLTISRLPSGTIIDIPVHVFRAPTDGPVVLLLAGMHGDEVNGIEIVRRLLRRKLLRPERGTILAVPVLNIFGFLNFSREVPDGKDVNRSFPGNARGSLASRVAAAFVKEILPWVDYGIDFHTGGANRLNYPQVRCRLDDAANARLAQAFGAPFQIHAGFRPNSLRKEAARKGKNIIVYECGESLRLHEPGLQIGMDGALRVLEALGLQKSELPAAPPGIVCQTTKWVRARIAGLFRNQVQVGQRIHKGEVIGSIGDPYGESAIRLTSPYSGYVIGLNHMAVVNQGDALVHVGLP